MADSSFSKDYRLLSARDFSYLRKGSKSVKNKWLKAYFKPSAIKAGSSTPKKSRIGISASKKVGKANIRNLCKRQIRETFRVSDFRESGLDVLIIVSPYLFKNIPDKSESKEALSSAVNHIFKLISKNVKN